MLKTLLCCAAAVTLPLGLGAGPRPLLPELPGQDQDDCAFEVERSATLGAGAGDGLALEHGAGSLRVEGRAGATGVRVVARGCASHREYLDDLQVETGRSGRAVQVVARYPRFNGWSGDERRYARLDMVVEVPMGMAAAIEDGSGSLELRGLGALDLEDGSGGIRLEDIGGPVVVDDGSGEIVIRGVRGNLHVDDGSGEVDITDVAGDVEVEDGSGGLSVRQVTGSVRVDDSSGDIEVRDVGRDFIVTDDGSGSIRHSGVRGRVDIPTDRRRGRGGHR